MNGPLIALLRLPFEIEIDDKEGAAPEAIVYRAIDECIERHMGEIEARVIELVRESMR